VQLVRGNAFLRAVHEREGEHPLVERDFAVFHDRSNGDGERLFTGVALVDAGARALALKLGDVLDRTAVRANRTVWPVQRFKVLAGFVGVVVDGIG
jgi:hypothetical protein